MTLPPGNGWTVPPPPGRPQGQVRGKMVAAGIGLAFGAQVVAIGLGVAAAFAFQSTSDAGVIAIYVELALQAVLFIACLVLGIVWIAKPNRDSGLGIGLLIGWAVSVLVFPIIGVGVCIAVLNSMSATS